MAQTFTQLDFSPAIKMSSNYSCNLIRCLIFETWHWDQSHSAGAVGDMLCVSTLELGQGIWEVQLGSSPIFPFLLQNTGAIKALHGNRKVLFALPAAAVCVHAPHHRECILCSHSPD